MGKRLRKTLAIMAVLSLLIMSLSGCFGGSGGGDSGTNNQTSNNQTDKNDNTSNNNGVTQTGGEESRGEPTEIKFGYHRIAALDPSWRDPVTGESGMAPDRQAAAARATQVVLDELNVKVIWVEYPSDIREALLQSVLANDPIADIALMWGGSQGTLLGQNIFQRLDDYQDLFADPDESWMLADPMFGHHYLLNFMLSFVNQWPLVYNINYLDQVDALKVDGKTVYPHDLWKEGKWTWSAFEDMLTKVNEYYANKTAPVRVDVPIKAFQTDFRFTALQAIHANGGAVFGADGLTADSPEAKEAVAFLDGLLSKGLMMSVRYGEDTSVPVWTANGNDFANGETVFTNMVRWLSGSAGQTLATRGESMGVVPFPRPDHMAADDPRYEQVAEPLDQAGLLKGVPKERAELALKAYVLYWSTFYKTLANGDKSLDYFTNLAKSEAVINGFDVTNEEYGEDIMQAFMAIASTKPNEQQSIMPWTNIWSDSIVGDSLYGLNGSPKYDAAIDAKKNLLIESMSAIQGALSSEELKDNYPPRFVTTGVPIAVAAGSDPSTIDWSVFVNAEDGIDGEIPFANVEVDTSNVDFSTVGRYNGALALAVKDAAGNEAKGTYAVTIYDPTNTTPPTVVVKEEYRSVKVDEDASAINWGNDFIESAVDKDGLDVKSNISADIGFLDVTTAGEYEVILTVTDFAGNSTELTLTVKVE